MKFAITIPFVEIDVHRVLRGWTEPFCSSTFAVSVDLVMSPLRKTHLRMDQLKKSGCFNAVFVLPPYESWHQRTYEYPAGASQHFLYVYNYLYQMRRYESFLHMEHDVSIPRPRWLDRVQHEIEHGPFVIRGSITSFAPWMEHHKFDPVTAYHINGVALYGLNPTAHRIMNNISITRKTPGWDYQLWYGWYHMEAKARLQFIQANGPLFQYSYLTYSTCCSMPVPAFAYEKYILFHHRSRG